MDWSSFPSPWVDVVDSRLLHRSVSPKEGVGSMRDLVMNPRIYHHVASNVMLDQIIYCHVASDMLIDLRIYSPFATNMVLGLRIWFNISRDIPIHSSLGRPPRRPHLVGLGQNNILEVAYHHLKL